jgi:hypothetical protein
MQAMANELEAAVVPGAFPAATPQPATNPAVQEQQQLVPGAFLFPGPSSPNGGIVEAGNQPLQPMEGLVNEVEAAVVPGAIPAASPEAAPDPAAQEQQQLPPGAFHLPGPSSPNGDIVEAGEQLLQPMAAMANELEAAGNAGANPNYTQEQLVWINSIADEAATLFPIGKVFDSPNNLRDELRSFAHKKGFAVTSDGSKLCCSRCEEPTSHKNKRTKRAPVPADKRRNRSTTRVGCSFQITYAFVDWKNKLHDKRLRITKSSNYVHSNGCLPSRSQLAVEKRKAGAVTVAIHEAQIKAILAVMATGTRVPTSMLREMMKPLFPEGTSIDSVLIFNFRLKIKRMLAKGTIDLASHTVSEDDERNLLSTNDLDKEQSPEFMSEVFRQFQDLLQEALKDQNDIKQISTYLESLSSCDPGFTYRIGWSADGSITGFVWQTGVMRRDFELFGDVLFVDCLGRSLNDKGWPINTIAMLDGEKKICLPCEGLTISESIEGYAWMIRSAVAMTPLRRLSDIKVIFGDGILAGESLLSNLGISHSCKLVLDHHHLISEDIGAWPKEFGLQLFAQLKADLTTMVKTWDSDIYSQALERVRNKVRSSAKFASYLEDSIHAKRHLFANHIIKSYPGTLNLQGNAPAESNHSSIIQRLGNLVETPVELIRSLIKRHADISAERSHKIQVHHLQSVAEATALAEESEKQAALTLSSWGKELFRKANEQSKRLVHTVNADGGHTFVGRNGSAPVILPAGAVSCTCFSWIAFNGTQCCHLLVTCGGYRINLWNQRWHQRSELEQSSAVQDQHSSGNDSDDDFGPTQPDDDGSVQDQEDQQEPDSTVNLTQESHGSQSRVALRDAVDLCRDLAYSINKLKREKDKQKLLLGAVVKLTEIAKGNVNSISAQTLEETLENQLNLFTRNMPSQSMFSQDSSADKENQTMRRAAPSGSNGGSRLRSANERALNPMKISSKRVPLCGLCHIPGHRVGRQCTIVMDFGATVVAAKEVAEFAAKLGNPTKILVEEPDGATKNTIKEWVYKEHDFPHNTKHMLVQRCFRSAKTAESFQHNILEVKLLEEFGVPILGHGPAYYPAHKVSNWIIRNCSSNGRKKHLLSSLSSPDVGLSQEIYNYSP